jgi:hypothetical protein
VSETGLLLNGKPPKEIQVVSTDGNVATCKAITYLYLYKRPGKVIGARKRKKALSASIKKYRFSLTFQKEN